MTSTFSYRRTLQRKFQHDDLFIPVLVTQHRLMSLIDLVCVQTSPRSYSLVLLGSRTWMKVNDCQSIALYMLQIDFGQWKN